MPPPPPPNLSYDASSEGVQHVQEAGGDATMEERAVELAEAQFHLQTPTKSQSALTETNQNANRFQYIYITQFQHGFPLKTRNGKLPAMPSLWE